MTFRVVLNGEDLHLPTIRLPVAVSIIVEWVGGTLPWARYIQNLIAIKQTVAITVSVICMSNILVEAVDYLLSVG